MRIGCLRGEPLLNARRCWRVKREFICRSAVCAWLRGPIARDFACFAYGSVKGSTIVIIRAFSSQAKGRSNAASALLLAAVVAVLALPSAVLALSVGIAPRLSAPAQADARSGFQPARVDPRLARSISVRALGAGQTFRFTPGAAPNRLDRSVTVAVRLDSNASRNGRRALSGGDGAGFGIAPKISL